MTANKCMYHDAPTLPERKVRAYLTLMDWDDAEVVHACELKLEVVRRPGLDGRCMRRGCGRNLSWDARCPTHGEDVVPRVGEWVS